MQNGAGMFFEFPSHSERRILYPATVGEALDRVFTARLEVAGVFPRAGLEVIIYFNHRGTFSKQAARIEMVMEGKPGPVIGFQVSGERVSAENRESFRVSTGASPFPVTVEESLECPVLDVSASGLSITTDRQFMIGRALKIRLPRDNRVFEGRASVQSIRALARNTYRYGLRCLRSERIDDTLEKGLQVVCMDLQKRQLRRRLGRASASRYGRS